MKALLIGLIILIAGPVLAHDDDRNPLDLRRTTLIVRDLDRSLAFYRDALGMTVQYDQEIISEDGETRSRLVLLRANDSFIGMLGLWQFLDREDHRAAAVPAHEFAPGRIVLLFNTEDQEATFKKAAAVDGVTVITEPRLRIYPADNGEFRVMLSMLTDPDGHAVELNKLLSRPSE